MSTALNNRMNGLTVIAKVIFILMSSCAYALDGQIKAMIDRISTAGSPEQRAALLVSEKFEMDSKVILEVLSEFRNLSHADRSSALTIVYGNKWAWTKPASKQVEILYLDRLLSDKDYASLIIWMPDSELIVPDDRVINGLLFAFWKSVDDNRDIIWGALSVCGCQSSPKNSSVGGLALEIIGSATSSAFLKDEARAYLDLPKSLEDVMEGSQSGQTTVGK